MSERSMNEAHSNSTHARIVTLIERILERPAGSAPIPPSARMNELGMSSMKMISLMLAIEVEFNLAIPQSDITPDNFESVASVEATVNRLLLA
jgi:acyl carrier protein